MTLQYLIDTAYDTDFYEEEAEDYLADKGVKIPTMSRRTLYKLAWANGWRPKEINKLV